MRSDIAFFALALTLAGATSAAAQSNRDVDYQNALLARSLSASDAQYCKNAGAPPSSPQHDACQVTRLFISDINAGQDKGVPPKTDIKYASPAEANLIMNAMQKWP